MNWRCTVKLALLALAWTSLTSCGTALFPRTVPLMVSAVTLPTGVGAAEDLSVGVRYIVSCNDSDQQIATVTRTASALTLRATARNVRQLGTACPAAVVERTLTYTDSGTPARTSPFEVVVNGKSWGMVDVR